MIIAQSIMPGITLKNIPEPLYNRLVEMARSRHRSLTKEVVVALERYVQHPTQDDTELFARIRPVRDRYPPTISAVDIEGWKESGWPRSWAISNFLAYLLLPTPYAAHAEAVLFKDSDWIAPTFSCSEFRNVNRRFRPKSFL